MDNSNELIATAAVCGITDQNKVLIPFLWTGSACLIGVPDIETFFTLTQKINEQKAQN